MRTVGVSDPERVAEHPLVELSQGFFTASTSLDLKNVIDHVFDPVAVTLRKRSCVFVKLQTTAKRLDAIKRHAFHVLIVKVQSES